MKGKVDEFKKSKEDYAELTGRLEAIEEEGRETGKKPNRMCGKGGKGGKGKGEKAADGEKPAERPADSVTKTDTTDSGTKTATTEDGSVTVEAGNGLRALRFLQRTLQDTTDAATTDAATTDAATTDTKAADAKGDGT